LPASVPRSGDPAPDIRLATAFGVEVELHPLLVEGPVLLEFIRGTWDPDGRARLAELGTAGPELRARYRARTLAVSCESPETARRYLEGRPEALPLVLDEARRAARAYGVFRRFSWGAINVALPASFVIDRCGFIRLTHVGRSPIDCAPLDRIIGSLDALEAESSRRPPGGAG